MSEGGEQSLAPVDEDSLSLLPRSIVGGVLMGLANLVPGISGGTMLLAAGIYPKFIEAVAEVTTFKFRRASMIVLGLVVLSAGASILLFAGPVKTLVVEHRWAMYSLFIGLTLGGVPLVWKLSQPASRATGLGAGFGFLIMAVIALIQSQAAEGAANEGVVLMFFAGILGASAMILPGISGGYLLLVLGVYVPILGAIDSVKHALETRELEALIDPTLQVVLPVGIGVVVGVVLVSNLLKVLFSRYRDGTLGVLLGFLTGAVVGLWPFQAGVKPEVGDHYRGQVLTAEMIEQLDPSKYPTEFFAPSLLQIAGALGLVLTGFGATALIARFGKSKAQRSRPPSS